MIAPSATGGKELYLTPYMCLCQVLIIGLVVGLLRLIYFLAVKAKQSSQSAGDAAAGTAESWSAAQESDAPQGIIANAKVQMSGWSSSCRCVCLHCRRVLDPIHNAGLDVVCDCAHQTSSAHHGSLVLHP